VGPQRRTGIDEPIPEPGDPGVEGVDDLGHGGALGIQPAGRDREQRDERAGEMDGDAHVPARQGTTAASTDQTGGRFSTATDHVFPSSALAKTWPLLVPK
jgi:hypothetical protein